MTVTREHLAGLELALELVAKIGPDIVWQALADLRDQAQSAEPVQGEAVEVVAYGDTDQLAALNKESSASCAVWNRPGRNRTALMTVAQHDRIMAPAKPDAELVELLRDVQACRKLTSVPLKIAFMEQRNMDSLSAVAEWISAVNSRIDAKLAELKGAP